MKNRYMKNEEFKKRQESFSFFCASALEFLESFKASCRKGWRELFAKKKADAQEQMKLKFDAFWADWTPEQNIQLFA